jgi:hypothetical protein
MGAGLRPTLTYSRRSEERPALNTLICSRCRSLGVLRSVTEWSVGSTCETPPLRSVTDPPDDRMFGSLRHRSGRWETLNRKIRAGLRAF